MRRSERLRMAQLDHNLVYRWFAAGHRPAVWHPTAFTTNSDRLLAGNVAAKFLAVALNYARVPAAMCTKDRFSQCRCRAGPASWQGVLHSAPRAFLLHSLPGNPAHALELAGDFHQVGQNGGERSCVVLVNQPAPSALQDCIGDAPRARADQWRTTGLSLEQSQAKTLDLEPIRVLTRAEHKQIRTAVKLGKVRLRHITQPVRHGSKAESVSCPLQGIQVAPLAGNRRQSLTRSFGAIGMPLLA
jgi:hypothetical protein